MDATDVKSGGPGREEPTGPKANAAVHAADCTPLVRAIRMAREIAYEGPPYENDWESHPAVRGLCDWWNQTGPAGCRKAGTFWLWVCADDIDVYLSGYAEEPSVPAGQFWGKDSNALFGDDVIVVFCESRSACKRGEGENPNPILLTVAGEFYESPGLDLEEYHPAWYALESLAAFPDSFPNEWEALIESVGCSGEIRAADVVPAGLSDIKPERDGHHERS